MVGQVFDGEHTYVRGQIHFCRQMHGQVSSLVETNGNSTGGTLIAMDGGVRSPQCPPVSRVMPAGCYVPFCGLFAPFPLRFLESLYAME